MQPRPRAETRGPEVPRGRCCMRALLARPAPIGNVDKMDALQLDVRARVGSAVLRFKRMRCEPVNRQSFNAGPRPSAAVIAIPSVTPKIVGAPQPVGQSTIGNTKKMSAMHAGA